MYGTCTECFSLAGRPNSPVDSPALLDELTCKPATCSAHPKARHPFPQLNGEQTFWGPSKVLKKLDRLESGAVSGTRPGYWRTAMLHRRPRGGEHERGRTTLEQTARVSGHTPVNPSPKTNAVRLPSPCSSCRNSSGSGSSSWPAAGLLMVLRSHDKNTDGPSDDAVDVGMSGIASRTTQNHSSKDQ